MRQESLRGMSRLRGMKTFLRGLREARGITQSEVANRLGVEQSSVSKAERRSDILLSTLGRFVDAMGGSVSIRVSFDDGQEFWARR